jgi:uncharacterized glyoxalase superfamily protein PhnB
VSLNVDDVVASAQFLTTHFGFQEKMATDGFAALTRDDAGMGVVFLRRGLDMLPEDQRDDHACGLILAFEVDDLEGELARLQAEGVKITMPLRSEDWGERAFQVRDPNGIIVELLDWNAPERSYQAPSLRTLHPDRRVTRVPATPRFPVRTGPRTGPRAKRDEESGFPLTGSAVPAAIRLGR